MPCFLPLPVSRSSRPCVHIRLPAGTFTILRANSFKVSRVGTWELPFPLFRLLAPVQHRPRLSLQMSGRYIPRSQDHGPRRIYVVNHLRLPPRAPALSLHWKRSRTNPHRWLTRFPVVKPSFLYQIHPFRWNSKSHVSVMSCSSQQRSNRSRVIDQGEAFEQQRAQWKQQASKSLGNKHTRSFSRARSKSLGSRHAHGHPTSESSKPQFNLEFLAARTLLGSQSTMPTVHITTPSNSSSHSKAYSHSHSQSAYSYSHTSHSHTHSHSHSHSHSLTTSNSSKSSRNLLSRGHSRKGSWSKPAFLKAGVLCGVSQDESYGASADERVPSSSRIDVQGTIHIVDSTNAGGAVSPFQSIPAGEVGIAITSSPALEGCFDLKVPGHPFVSGPRHQEGDQEGRWPPKYTQNSSGYAGPHPSVIDSNLPPLGATNGVSLRHRLPPRAAIHPPIALIAHPYRSASAQPEQVGDNSSEGATSKVSESQGATEPTEERTYYPHISLSHADFEQYGVGEALVYASHPRPEEVAEAEQTNVESTSSLAVPPEEQSSSRETVVLQPEEPDTSSLAMNSPPSLTNSTIRMVMSGLDDPEDLDEFQDLFYKPHLASGAQQQESSVTISQVPTDVHSSASSSPLTHLVRKLSERAHNLRDPSRTPSDPTRLQTSESQDHHSNDGETKFVFTDLARSSSSLPHVESSSQVHLPIQKGSESVVQPFMVIPEDVNSSYTASVLESPLDECENDTFGKDASYVRIGKRR